MNILVVGGAGYIGAHVVRLLHEAGENVTVVDDLSSSDAARVGAATLEVLDVSCDEATQKLAEIMRRDAIDGVIHFAAKKQVGESVARPMYYCSQNVGGLANVLEACRIAGVKDFIFSSSAATYGQPSTEIVTEDSPTQPINPYGRTKLIGEWMMADCEKAWGLNWIALRYFNVAGAGWPELGDPAIMNLIPMVFDRLERGEAPRVFGADYDTPDGSCIRDYVDVKDLAQAHIVSLQGLKHGVKHRVFNVGTGTGASVIEVIETIGRVTGLDTTPVIEPRRPGDPAVLVGSADRLERELGFRSTTGLEDIVRTAWEAWQAGPRRIDRVN